VLLKVLFQIFAQLAAFILELFSISEWEEVKLVFTIVLPLAILLFFLCLQKLIVISHKLISFVHKKLVLALSVSCHLFTHLLYYVLLSLSCEHKVALCLGKLILHLFDIFVADLLKRRHFSEIDALSESSVYPTLKHTWETRDSNPSFFVQIAHLLISKAIEHVFSGLWIRV
jgi:hypothetical protein